MTKTMKAILLPSLSSPAILTMTRPIPSPSPHEVLIKVTSTSLNPHDQKVRDAGKLIPAFPWIPGADVAGVVTQLGNGVTKYALGDHVFGQTNFLTQGNALDHCGAQEYALVDVWTSARVPEGMADDDAVSMPTNAVAALWGFFGQMGGLDLPLACLDLSTGGGSDGSGGKEGIDDGGKDANNPDGSFDATQHDLVILGGGSQLGKLTIQIAHLLGFRAIVAVASLSNQELLQSQGATHIIDRHLPFDSQVTQIRDIVGHSLRYCINAVSPDRTLGVAVLSDSVQGHLTSFVSGAVEYRERVGLKKAGFKETFTQGLTLAEPALGKVFWGADYEEEEEEEEAEAAQGLLPRWLEEGVLKVPKWTVIKGLDVERVNRVLDDWRDGRAVAEHVHVHPSG